MNLPFNLSQTAVIKSLKTIRLDFYIFAVLIFLSILGVGIADAFETPAHWYWMGMVPVYFAACIFLEWQAIRHSGKSLRDILLWQTQHWLGVLAAFFLTFKLREIGSLDNQATGLILLLLLALGTFLAGITTGWLFRLLGIFLGINLIMVAYMEHYVAVTIASAAAMLLLYHYLAKSLDLTIPERGLDDAAD
ncbi:hypothetical protein PL263_07505 [Methylomonas sp. EFPC3]|uniref:hypothetical protein n=1 Tax=Methylomonas sp. EFPC3 TaxID=3021710 RepID=UPI0024169094|nr:hypothetical protein [Methylomonas sp. EFPC3]WFP51868.1 hypothetical protein PL263_07505 [Methylomonas sp. EFPC3]